MNILDYHKQQSGTIRIQGGNGMRIAVEAGRPRAGNPRGITGPTGKTDWKLVLWKDREARRRKYVDEVPFRWTPMTA